MATLDQHTKVAFYCFLASLLLTGARVQAAVPDSILVGNLGSPYTSLSFLNPQVGFAQKFTVDTGIWNITQATVFLGGQYPGYEVTPLLQIRNGVESGGPGTTILGSFAVDPNDIPPFILGNVNMAEVSTPAASSFSLEPGDYWLCLINPNPSTGALYVGSTDPGLLVEDGVGGHIVTDVDLYESFDGGASFSDFGPYPLLMEVNAQLVPEPTTFTLLTLGSLALVMGRRRR